MPVQAKADNNVPFTPGRARYSLVGTSSTLLQHTGVIDGKLPSKAATAADLLDPVVSGGKATWGHAAVPSATPPIVADLLNHGGLFAFGGRPLIVEALIGSGTWTIVDALDQITRPTPTTFPFTLFGSEQLKCNGGTTAGVIVKLAGQKVI